MWYCFNAGGGLVDYFEAESDAYRYCRDHAGCHYCCQTDLTDGEWRQAIELRLRYQRK